MRYIFCNGSILTPTTTVTDHYLVVEESCIVAITAQLPAARPGDHSIDVQGKYIVPGFIDVHTHGCAGYDILDAKEESIQGMAAFYAQHGVTSFLPTTLTASASTLQAVIDCVAHCPQPLNGAQILGIHMEGPYLNIAYEGAQPGKYIRAPQQAEWQPWLESGVVKLMTVAPEIPGVSELVAYGLNNGVTFALGHSGATAEQVVQAADAGISQVSHMFNGMLGFHHRAPGAIGGVLLEDRMLTQIIADGYHVHPKAIALLIRAKGVDKIMLITDSLRPAGLPDGLYKMGEETVISCDGVVRTSDGKLAGTLLTMDRAVRFMHQTCGIALPQAAAMASHVPAKSIGIAARKGTIAAGYDADIVVMDRECTVSLTMVMGRIVYAVS